MKHFLRKLLSPQIGSRCLLVGLAIVMSGCGGGAMSQQDMMRMSRRRIKKDDEDEPAKVAKATIATPPAATANADANPPTSPAPNEDRPPTVATAATRNPEQPQAAPAIQQPSSGTVELSEGLSDTQAPPAKPRSFQQRCQLSAANLERIGQALEAYAKDHGKYPQQAVYAPSKMPLLSWRVELLPYLGYQQLYDALDKTKPWNSPANKPFLEKIPAVYQSPERFDSRSNYLLATGRGTMFAGPRTTSFRRMEDGIEHTAVLVEVDDRLAVPWTKPKEYETALGNPKDGLGQLRQGHVFVIWGGGMAGAVSADLPAQDFKALYTCDGGEAFSSFTASVPIDDEFLASLPTDSLQDTASAAQPSQASPGARPGPTNSRTIVASATGLASTYRGAARLAYTVHQTGDAMLWYYASNILQHSATRWDASYHWVAALRRPSPTVHFCVGVLGKRDSPTRTPRGRNRSRDGRAAIESEILEAGTELLSMIESHAATLIPKDLEAPPAESPARPATGNHRRQLPAQNLPVTYLGSGSNTQLTTEASAIAGDVLVLFKVKRAPPGNQRWLACDLIDLAKGRKIVSLPTIRWESGPAALQELSSNELFKKGRWQLEDTLEDLLSLRDWPDALKPRHAAARVAGIADSKGLNPLVALAEITAYRNRGLIDDQQLLDGFRNLLGDEAGESLMLGSDKRRSRVLRTWLPDVQPSELQQLATLQRKGRDDDD